MSLPLSGFTAVPNPQMLAFMGSQSFIMMMQAGEGWQYGKRKQSAMTNEEFNAQTPLSIMQRQMSELKQAIPSIAQNMNNMTPLINTIVTQYGDFMAEIIKAIPDTLAHAQGGQTLEGNIVTVGKEFQDILKNLFPSTPTGDNLAFGSHPPPPVIDNTPITNTISTPDLSVYNNMNLTQLQQARANASGTLASYLDTLINNVQQSKPDTSIDITTQAYITEEIRAINQILAIRANQSRTGQKPGSSYWESYELTVNKYKEVLSRFYLSYRGTVGLQKLTPSWRTHNANMISQRAWTKY